jgi:putative flippase GtrA
MTGSGTAAGRMTMVGIERAKVREQDRPDTQPSPRSSPGLVSNLVKSRDERVVALRFVIVGGSLLVLHMVLATLFTMLGLLPAAANVTAHLIGIPPTYLAQRGFAFRSDAPHARAFVRYLLLQIPLMALGAVLAWLIVGQLGWHPAAGFLVIVPSVALVSYAAQRFWAFAHR